MNRLPSLWCLAVLSISPLLGLAAEPSAFTPDPLSVQRHGPAYRYPQAGWIVLHIEGTPHERGYQHGRLLAPEIAGHIRCFAAMQSSKAPEAGWKQVRTLVNALFLRRFHPEFLEEMKGIADGAAASGAKFDKRPVDLLDIVALNCWAEIETLESALEALPTGLEGRRFPHAGPKAMPGPKPMHCSAFAATGPATADGKIVFGHITMFSLYPASFYNVWLDIKPSKGHRMVMQTYPGGIQSGMDYYLNSAGLIVCETTIDQTRFEAAGLTVASRIRQAVQYSDSIDGVVHTLKKENNGLYTNEWLIADVKTNEIAMFELGTHKTRLWRSSKDEWFAGTPGFYWGCNNTKDLHVRLETIPGVQGRPENLVWRPSERDKTWQRLYAEHKGKIDAGFGRLAFTTPPVAAYHSLDAKYTTTDLAKQLKTVGMFGPPLGRTWQPTQEERKDYPDVRPLVSNPWTLLQPTPLPSSPIVQRKATDLTLSADHPAEKDSEDPSPSSEPAWFGTLLPKTDGDAWLAAAFAGYERYVALENARRERSGGENSHDTLSATDRERLTLELFAHRSGYLAAARAVGDTALLKVRSEPGRDEWYQIASGKGVLLLHELRHLLGDPLFLKAMESFGKQHAGKEVSTAEFRAHCEALGGQRPVAKFFDRWLREPGLPPSSPREMTQANGAVFSTRSFRTELSHTLIIRGTRDEEPTNREAAEALQRALIESGPNLTVPIKADTEVTDADLKSRHLLLIGGPDSNSLVARFRGKLPIAFGPRSFVVRAETYAHAGSAVCVAVENPLNPRYSMVVIAGLSADATWRAAPQLVEGSHRTAEVLVFPHNQPARTYLLSVKDRIHEFKP